MPASLVAFVRDFMTRRAAIPAASLLRILLAVLLWFSAPVSRTPLAFQTLAVVAVLAAIVLPLLGKDRVTRLIDRISSWPGLAMRAWCLLGVAFGVFLLWSVYPAVA